MNHWAFIEESNRIEGIDRAPLKTEIEALERFLGRPTLYVDSVVSIVSAFQPDARLRNQVGLDVRVGSHFPPPGCPEIYNWLDELLHAICHDALDPFEAHVRYETLHPFTDGNGRSGRAIWAWQMKRLGDPTLELGFLHAFYYQTLQAQRSP